MTDHTIPTQTGRDHAPAAVEPDNPAEALAVRVSPAASPGAPGAVARRRAGRGLRVRFRRLAAGQAGLSTIEYAMGTLAAAALAAVLYLVVNSNAVQSAISGIITGALENVPG